MRATFRNLLEAKRREREEETGEAGFSLIELIIVVVILGILVAIAIPVFGSLTKNSEQQALNTAAANGATSVAAALADEDTATTATTATAKLTNSNMTVAIKSGTSTTPDNVCVTATPAGGWADDGLTTPSAGPGC